MKRPVNMLERQGDLLLSKLPYAYAITFLFASLPLLSVLALAIIALLTLRLGPVPGIKALLAAAASVLLMNLLTTHTINAPMLLSLFFTLFPLFFAAYLLRITASWQHVSLFLILLASLVILSVHLFMPGAIENEYNTLLLLLKSSDQKGVDLSTWLNDKNKVMAYILGFQTFFLMLSTITTLMIARAFQSRLFNPEGFKSEMLLFCASPFMLLPYVAILAGFYFQYPLCTALLPIWSFYFAAAGLSVLISLFSAHRPMLMGILLLVTVVFLPFFMIPLMVSIGALDALFHFRKRLNKQNPDKNSFKEP